MLKLNLFSFSCLDLDMFISDIRVRQFEGINLFQSLSKMAI